MNRPHWWQAPLLRRDAESGGHRRVSWLELFFDLVFVALIAKLSHALGAHLNAAGVIAFVLTLLPVWWVWIAGVVYNERFETDDVRYRLLMLSQLLGVAVMGVFVEGGVTDNNLAFSLSYVATRGVAVLAWWRAGQHNPQVKPIIAREVVGYSANLLLWTISAFLTGPLSLLLKAAGLLADLLTPALVQRLNVGQLPKISTEKIAERFGLLVIIVLGESLVRALNGVTPESDLTAFLRLGVGVVLAFSLWWLYFDHLSDRHADLDGPAGFMWAYGHLPLIAGVVAMAAAVTPIITGTTTEAHATRPASEYLFVAATSEAPGSPRWIFAGALALVYLALNVIDRTLSTPVSSKTLFLPLGLSLSLGAGLALVLAFLPLSDAGLLLGMTLVSVLLVINSSPLIHRKGENV